MQNTFVSYCIYTKNVKYTHIFACQYHEFSFLSGILLNVFSWDWALKYAFCSKQLKYLITASSAIGHYHYIIAYGGNDNVQWCEFLKKVKTVG